MEKNSKQEYRLIDLHAHIVPGVDDGAHTFEDSLKMLQIAEADGIETIVATPHVFSVHNTIKSLEEIIKQTQKFLDELNQYAINLQVLQGTEVFFISNIMDYLKEYGETLFLNHGSYFLLEFPFDFVFPGTQNFLFNAQAQGWVPIIVHPERNKVIQRNPGILYDWIKIGALIQVNAGSLTGLLGEAAQYTSFQLLRYNLVHIIASDAHSPNHRTPELSFVHSLLKKEGIRIADLLVYDIPRAILYNETIADIGEPRDPRKKKKIFDFLRKNIMKRWKGGKNELKTIF